MPNLPTLSVTTAQANRMLAAYGSPEAYQEWLRQQIVQYVIAHEVQGVALSVEQQMVDKKAEVIAALPSPPKAAVSTDTQVPTP